MVSKTKSKTKKKGKLGKASKKSSTKKVGTKKKTRVIARTKKVSRRPKKTTARYLTYAFKRDRSLFCSRKYAVIVRRNHCCL